MFGVLLRADDSVERVWRAGTPVRNAVLPVTVDLPGRDGWVVAAQGQVLSYRTGADWRAAGSDAALLPEGTVEVKVGETPVELG